MTRKILPLILILFIPACAKPQSTNHSGPFPTIDHTGTLSDRFDYSLYYFAGFNSVSSEVPADPGFFVLYLEQALTYKADSRLSFSGSYVYERLRPMESNYRNENRFYLQSVYKYNLSRTGLKHRLRYDGRFIEDRHTNAWPYTSRIRYLFGITSPLTKNNNRLYFTAYNEFFFNLDKRATAIYGENWAYAGIGLKTDKAGTFEAGPLYIFWVTDKQNNLANFHYLQLSWITYVDFRKTK